MFFANNVYLNQWKTLRARVMIESFSIQHLEDVEEDFSLVQEGDLGKDYIRRKVKNTVKKNENTYELAILVSYNETHLELEKKGEGIIQGVADVGAFCRYQRKVQGIIAMWTENEAQFGFVSTLCFYTGSVLER